VSKVGEVWEIETLDGAKIAVQIEIGPNSKGATLQLQGLSIEAKAVDLESLLANLVHVLHDLRRDHQDRAADDPHVCPSCGDTGCVACDHPTTEPKEGTHG
jgi:hypothetical protein